jgi:phosphoribosylpyrophosphate synthetase
VCLDLHAAQIQGFFDIPCDNLNAMPFFVKYIKECIPDYEKAVILAKNAGGAKRCVKCCTGQGRAKSGQLNHWSMVNSCPAQG